MLVSRAKEILDDLGMEYEETWIPAFDPRWKCVEVFFTEEQIAEEVFGDWSLTSQVFTGGWPDAISFLRETGIL
jgi:hypothetical protein